MKTYMMTVPRSVPKRALRIMIECNDVKKWIIGIEKGRSGYDHYQIRIKVSNDNFFDWCKVHIPSAHVEEGQDLWEYERKEGRYWCSNDTPL